MPTEYRTITEIAGPLIFVEKTEWVGYGELVEVGLPDGTRKRGQVLDSSKDIVVVQVFEGTAGIDRQSTVKFLGETIKLNVSRDMLGRILSGAGEPIDGGPPIVPEKRVEITGSAINPYSREHPAEFIQTGISTIDGLNTLVRGQKLPLFSGAGLPHGHDELRRGLATDRGGKGGSAWASRVSGLYIHGLGNDVRARRSHPWKEGQHHANPDHVDPGRRLDPPDRGPDRVHHGGPDRDRPRPAPQGDLPAGGPASIPVATHGCGNRQGPDPRGPQASGGPALCRVRGRKGCPRPRRDRREGSALGPRPQDARVRGPVRAGVHSTGLRGRPDDRADARDRMEAPRHARRGVAHEGRSQDAGEVPPGPPSRAPGNRTE